METSSSTVLLKKIRNVLKNQALKTQLDIYMTLCLFSLLVKSLFIFLLCLIITGPTSVLMVITIVNCHHITTIIAIKLQCVLTAVLYMYALCL